MKKFLQKILNSFKSFRVVIKNFASQVIDVLASVNEAISDPKFDLLVALTPTKVDDAVLSALRVVLKEILPVLPKGKKDIILKFVEHARELHSDQKDALLFKVASLTTKAIAAEQNHNLTTAESDLLTQMAFIAKKVGAKI